ncbi:MAG: Glyoxalase/bleomycin resistance protein/dioxygenase [Solirubrobacterales bacterium]|nr:Glyoxalase/bleomycin resistance protein/dioxygenase [Solirubrobacterales bacterium]
MFDHVTARVSDRAQSERFFETVLVPLGIDATYRSTAFAVWDDFEITQTDAAHEVTRRLHIAFAAPTREQVDAFWQAGVDAGYEDDGRPGLRPEYADDYYGAFLRDPDGNSVEAVHRDGRRHRDGVVDHVRIRVAELEPAAVFYRAVAETTGIVIRRDDAFGLALSRDEAGGAFSLVPGLATENVHLAFAGDDDTIRRFYETLVGAGFRGNGEPGERPSYHPGYYAAYVLDPDGNNIEVVDHHRA